MAKKTIRPSAQQLDILKTIGSIGAKQAALALSQLVKRNIEIIVPKVGLISPDEILNLIESPQTSATGIYMNLMGDVKGKILFLLSQKNALSLADILTQRKVGSTRTLATAQRSALKEATAILAGNFTRVLNQFLGLLFLASIPNITQGKAEVILKRVTSGIPRRGKSILTMGTDLSEAQTKIKGHFLIIPEAGALEILLGTIEETFFQELSDWLSTRRAEHR